MAAATSGMTCKRAERDAAAWPAESEVEERFGAVGAVWVFVTPL